MSRVLGPLQEPHLGAMAQQLHSVRKGRHTAGTLHLDVKPWNILWLQLVGKLTLVDLGMAERIGGSELRHEVYCTQLYRAPELLRANPNGIVVKESI